LKLIKWLPVFIWAAVICWLSFSSLKEISVPKFFSSDKVAHLGVYFIMELLFFIPIKGKKNFLIASFFALLFSGIIELIQHFFVFNRFGDVADLLANAAGLLIGYLVLSKKLKN